MNTIQHIALPTRPQPDTIVAIFLLRTFGKECFPGVETAHVEVQHAFPPEETFEILLDRGILAIDVGSGPFDHHGTSFCATELVAAHLKIQDNPALARLIQYARRDDLEGKGTLSTDPIDRSFGLSGLIASLNKSHIDDPHKVVETALPLIEAHYLASKEHHIDLPQDIETKKKIGHYHEFRTRQGKKNLKISYVVSDKPSMPTFLRSQQGAQADIVVQKSEHTNHICVLTKQERKIDLAKPMALIRLREAELQGIDLQDDLSYLEKHGRIDEIPYWYFDPVTNSLLNGGPHNREVPESKITWDELKRIIRVGIELPTTENAVVPNGSYYLSINLPQDYAEQVLEKLSNNSKDVKVHDPKNLHVTLEYFGEKTQEEIEEMAASMEKAFKGKSSLTLQLRDSHLKSGSPEGYSHAWYLDIDNEDGIQQLHSLRNAALEALGMPLREKPLHITVAAQRSTQVYIPEDSVEFKNSFEVAIPISEIVLMQSIQQNGRRIYSPHTTYSLT